jgi:hypothetical protein
VSQGVGALDPNGKLQCKPHVEAPSRSRCDSCAPQAAFERLDGICSNAHEYGVVVRGGHDFIRHSMLFRDPSIAMFCIPSDECKE